MGRHPRFLRVVRRARDAYRLRPLFARIRWLQPAIDRIAARVEGEVVAPAQTFVESASHYLITAGGRQVRVCVDADDDGGRIDEQVVDWSDVYFKTNYWPTLNYAPKIQPFVNADPLVIPQLDTFRRYRSVPKEHDLCMVVRVWGGKDEVEGVEHNLRLIEAVARARCTKFLYAYLVAGDISAAARRLERQGIPCGTAPVPPARLWRISAASRLNVIRLGMHYCVPWRVTGALAIGSGIVLDRAPLTRWPEPLTAGMHYLALGTETDTSRPLATDAQYADIPGKIEAWLGDRPLAGRLGRNNADYYDRFVAPQQVGQLMVAAAARFATGGSPPR
ncbi:MAG TPA: hypothetical protein VHS09_14075 [Polyangiaceae bacterium]|jgi:hypothetical protein|nr:hypothetical protein [Polyangiaceae bacterium]